MAPRLDQARRRVSNLIARSGSTCQITHNPLGIDDDTYDPVTMQLVPPNPETTLVYVGPCLLRPAGQRYTRREGDNPMELGDYEAILPFDATVPAVGDVLTVTAPGADPSTAAMVATVTNVDSTDLLVWRRLRLQTKAPAQPRTE